MRQLYLALGLMAQMLLISPAMGETLDLADPNGWVFGGVVTVQALSMDGDQVLHHASGAGRLILSPTQGDVLTMKGSARIDGERVIGFDHSLRQQPDGSWLEEKDDMRMEIAPSGTITVSATSDEGNIEGNGTITAQAVRLQLRFLPHATQPGLIFDFDLPSGLRSAESKPDRDCEQTVWQQRFIANPFRSTMSTVMVPVCVPAR